MWNFSRVGSETGSGQNTVMSSLSTKFSNFFTNRYKKKREGMRDDQYFAGETIEQLIIHSEQSEKRDRYLCRLA